MKVVGDFFRIQVNIRFDDMAAFLKTIEAQLVETKQREQKRVESKLDCRTVVDAEDAAELADERQQELAGLDDRFSAYSRIHRYSFIITLFILVETQLRAVCDEISKRKKLELRMNDLRGDLRERTKTFLEKVATVLDISNGTWETMADLQKVRDCIVHTDGTVEESRDRDYIRNLIGRKEGLGMMPTALDEGKLSIECSFCEQALKAVTEAFREIFEKAGCFGLDHWKIQE